MGARITANKLDHENKPKKMALRDPGLHHLAHYSAAKGSALEGAK